MKTNINKPFDLLLSRFGIIHIVLILMVNILLLTPYFIAPKKVYKVVKKDGGTIGDVKTY
jgi:Sec-independent protein translocase protein TatA